MLIRPATAADVPQVLPMVRQICALHESWDAERYPMIPNVVARYEHWLPQRAADPRSVFLVAETEEPPPRIAGFLVSTIEKNIPIYRLEEFAFIHDVWVDPPFRKHGAARALVDAAIDRFRALGVSQVRLETASLNDSARRLFSSGGFRVSTIDMLRTITPTA
jgi:ribosomal protein S18 acetylase RimI-like enzyme